MCVCVCVRMSIVVHRREPNLVINYLWPLKNDSFKIEYLTPLGVFKEKKVTQIHTHTHSHKNEEKRHARSFTRCRMFSPAICPRCSTINCTIIIETDVSNIIIMYFVSFFIDTKSKPLSNLSDTHKRRKSETPSQYECATLLSFDSTFSPAAYCWMNANDYDSSG